MTEMATTALGCAVHSGWAVVVGVSLDGGSNRVLLRERIELMNPGDPGSKQPYHSVEGLPIPEAGDRLVKYAATAQRLAGEAVRGMVGRLREGGHRTVALGILDSAGRKGSRLADILASHALIHTADGDHFRSALAGAAARLGLPVVRVQTRELDAKAAEVTREPIGRLKLALKDAGRDLGPPWGADQKAAALLACLVLAAGRPEVG